MFLYPQEWRGFSRATRPGSADLQVRVSALFSISKPVLASDTGRCPAAVSSSNSAGLKSGSGIDTVAAAALKRRTTHLKPEC